MTDTDISQAAALFGDPARARMLLALIGGYARPASELARLAHIAPQTASAHLAKLQHGGLITVQRRGRWRYYRLAGPEVAGVIEALQNLCGSGKQADELHLNSQSNDGLKMCRTCYDHLAGCVAVSLADALVGREHLKLAGETYHLTASGTAVLEQFGIDTAKLNKKRRRLARPCPD